MFTYIKSPLVQKIRIIYTLESVEISQNLQSSAEHDLPSQGLSQ